VITLSVGGFIAMLVGSAACGSAAMALWAAHRRLERILAEEPADPTQDRGSSGPS